jgi:FkbM family methyltransferase
MNIQREIDELFNLATQCLKENDYKKAESFFVKILEQDFEYSNKYFSDIYKINNNNDFIVNKLGLVYLKRNDCQNSLKYFKKAIKINNSNIDAYFNAALALTETKNYEEAIKYYHEIIKLDKNNYRAYTNIGTIYLKLKKYHEAITNFNDAISINNNPLSSYYMAHTLAILNDFDNACKYYQQTITLNPDYFEAYIELAGIQSEQGFLEDAYTSYSKALSLRKDNIDTYNDMGILLQKLGRLNDSIDYYNKALEIDKSFAPAYNNLGNAYAYRGQLELAIENYNKSISLDSSDIACYSNYLFCFNYHPDIDPIEVLNKSKQWEKKYRHNIKTKEFYSNIPIKNRRLRIGYLSSSLFFHPVAFFLEPIISNHNRNKFTICIYSNINSNDAITNKIKNNVDIWRDIAKLNTEQVIDLINSDSVDILIDLDGHTANNRLEVFAHKPAPVQVSYLGYPNTTGISTIDYRITDSLADPPEITDYHYSEKLLRLPNCFLCYKPPELDLLVNDLPALNSEYITFASFNNTAKINFKVVECWSKILLAIPNSRLLLKSMTTSSDDNWTYIKEMFRKNNVPDKKIEIRGRTPDYHAHMQQYHEVDIALDTFPYNGTTTTCDALWMGVPVITFAGEVHRSRVSASILTNIGMPDFITHSIDEYINKALKLTGNLTELASIRRGIRKKLCDSSLCDSKALTLELENQFKYIWSEWSNKNKSSNIDDFSQKAVQCLQSSQFELAIEYYQYILSIKPECAEAYSNIAIAYQNLGDLETAEYTARKAIFIKPDLIDAHLNLANILKDKNDIENSIEQYKKVILLKPDYAEAYNNLGFVYNKTGFLSESLKCLKKAVSLNSNLAEIFNNLGNVYKDFGEIEKAIESFKRSLSLSPTNRVIQSNFLYSLSYQEKVNAIDVYNAHKKWGNDVESNIIIQPATNQFEVDKKLKVGYVSPDLYMHSVGYFIESILSEHDHSKFEIIIYSKSTKHDLLTERLKSYSDIWHNIKGWSDLRVYEQIQKDETDILIDLAGHTANNSLQVFAMKPVPIQISYLGYPNTTGLLNIDYKITDYWADPVEYSDDLYTEELIRIPMGFLCYKPQPDCPSVNKNNKNKKQIIFASFNNYSKMNKKMLTMWAQILKKVPNSKLVIKSKQFKDKKLCKDVKEFFYKNEINRNQIELFSWSQTYREHMELYNKVDICLDTYPYNGTTTTCEALWMSTPVITLVGRTHISRVGLSILSQLGLTDLTANTEDEYIEKAIQLASNLKMLTEQYSTLREKISKSSLVDSRNFTKLIELEYLKVWAQYCNSKKNEVTRDRKLNIGGKYSKQGWEIFDIVDNTYVDHVGDASDLSRFKDNTFSEVYASHILEHLNSTKEVSQALKEWNRVLLPGGTLYISVPSLDTLCRLFIDEKLTGEERYSVSRMMYGGHTNKYDYHKMGVTKEFLEYHLIDAGFIDFSEVEEFGIFEDTSSYRFNGVKISLNVVSRKPLKHDINDIDVKKSIANTQVDSNENNDLDNIKYIFILGIRRSGTTWIYNIVKEILNFYDKGEFIGYIGESAEIDSYLTELSEKNLQNKKVVIKFHEFSRIAAEMLDANKAIAIYSQRDLRDVAASEISLLHEKFEDYMASDNLKFNIKNHEKWNRQKNIINIEYENIIKNPVHTIIQISYSIGFPIDWTLAKEINKDVIPKELRDKEIFDYNKESLLLENHISSGIGCYKDDFSEDDIRKLESDIDDWLIKNKYKSINKRNVLTNYYETEKKGTILPVKIKGDIVIGVPNDIHSLTTYILLEQEDWFESEIHFIRKFLKKGMNCIDIGSNYGIYTLAIAKCIGDNGHIHAFEPTKSIMPYFLWSIRNNNFNNIIYNQYALSDKTGIALLSHEENTETNKIINNYNEKTRGVVTRTLDAYVEQNDLINIDFIKIDAEGHEVNIIDGALKFLKNNSPLIMFEIRTNDIINHELIKKVMSVGYCCYKLVPGFNILIPFNIDEELDLFQLNIFCCKPDREIDLLNRGLLLNNTYKDEKNVEVNVGNLWHEYLCGFKYTEQMIDIWKIRTANYNDEYDEKYLFALSLYCLSHKTNKIDEAYSLLIDARDIIKKLLEKKVDIYYLQTYARILIEMGERENCLFVLDEIIRFMSLQKISTLDKPFLCVSTEFEEIKQNKNYHNWCLASVIEQKEKLRSFSSYFTNGSTLQDVEKIKQLGFVIHEMERRSLLIKMHFYQNDTDLIPDDSLLENNKKNLNPELWGDEKVNIC